MTWEQAANLPTTGYITDFDGIALKGYHGEDKALIATGIFSANERYFYVKIHSDGVHDYFKYKYERVYLRDFMKD